MNRREYNFTSKAIKREFEEIKHRAEENPNYGKLPHPPKISWWLWIKMVFKRIIK